MLFFSRPGLRAKILVAGASMPIRRLLQITAAAMAVLAATTAGALDRDVFEQLKDMPEGSAMDAPLALPEGLVETELAVFRLETVATGLDPHAFSIAPLPDGRILLTEKKRGLSIIHPDGSRTGPIEGAPSVSDSGIVRDGLDYGVGWHLDVAPHPDYAENGWIYLHHTDLCGDCRKKKWMLFFSKSMNRLVRGRIEEDRWIDQEIIWDVDEKYYTPYPDLGAGGRVAFDTEGHVYVSVGTKGGDYEGIQNLATPYGKIHRVRDDGAIPSDNPFLGREGVMPSLWSYGHRVPQGLEFESGSGRLWGSEMGPEGGDEINWLRAGRNYGWPLVSHGVNYDGSPVDYGKKLGIEFNPEDIEQPVVDMTPAPAVSSFIIYEGEAFPAWRGHFLVASLRARTLYRIVIEGERHVHSEILVGGMARIRDLETGPGGLVYLLLEHESGSRIVRLAPDGADD